MNRFHLTLSLLLVAAPAIAQTDAATLIERGRLRDADALLTKRVAEAPNDADALVRLSRIRNNQGRLEEGQSLAERATQADPKSAEARYALAECYGAAARKSKGLGALGKAKRFKKETEAALALDPKHADALEGMIMYNLEAPGIAGGDKKKIPPLLDQLTAVDPVMGWMVRGNVAMDGKDSTRAESCYRKAVELETSGVRARLNLAGWLSAPWRKPAEADRIAREVVAKEPWRQGAWGLIAANEAQAGHYDELDKTLAEAEAADPGHLGATYAAARTLVIAGREPQRAERYLRRYLEVEPEIGYPRHAGARWRLAQALEQQGKKDAAIAELQVAVHDQPDLEGAKKDLKRLSR